MGIFVYVDGFNFYYRVFKNERRRNRLPAHDKWLNILELSSRLMPNESIDWIGYFTAFGKPNAKDPTQQLRQRAYIEALRTIPRLEIIPGKFQPTVKWGVPHRSTNRTPVQFDTFEEKGSDVNLASRLVWDAARNAFSEAVVISNDSDLAEAIRLATMDAGQKVHVRSPDLSTNNALKKVATSAELLDVKLLKRSLFPEELTNRDGVRISRPAAWSPPKT